MFFDNSYFTVAIYLALIVAVVLPILHWHQSTTVDGRLQRMMVSCGIDEKSAVHAEQLLNLDMDAARSRCRNCQVTVLCDRWLDGETDVNNSFCPNAWLFTRAAG
jgi:hypothetical protein